MYIPRHFEMTPAQACELLASAETIQLVTAHETGPVATLLPAVHVPDEGLGAFFLHVTRTNAQWQDTGLGQALAICSGPDAYIAPEWLASFTESPGVPTWNYVTVHAYGELVVHDDREWVLACVRRLSLRHGYDVGLLDEQTLDRMLRPIVGLELRIERVEAKAKLSQNRAPADVAGIVAGLRHAGEGELAEVTASISLPHAEARYAMLDGIRTSRRLGPVQPTPGS